MAKNKKTAENKRILTLRDVVEFVADDYRIETLRFPHNEISEDGGIDTLCGLCIYNKKEILINQNLGINLKRLSILHEFYHALYSREGLHQNERLIDSLSQKHFKKLYEK